MKLEQLFEGRKEKETKGVFIPEDPQKPFPDNTVDRIKRDIAKYAKDPDMEWEGGSHLVKYVLNEYGIERPKVSHKVRWEQFLEFIRVAIEALFNARGEIE